MMSGVSVKVCKPWTAREVSLLKRNAHLGADALAIMLERSPESIRQAAKWRQISLRKPGSRRGRIVGQPRTARWKTEDAEVDRASRRVLVLRDLREAIISGDISPNDLLRKISEMTAPVSSAPLCPSCTRAPQLKNGLCRTCHIDGLIAAYVEEDAQKQREQEVGRIQAREWQRRSRARRKDES